MILVDRLVGESLPFDGVRGGDDDPVPEWLIPAGWVEQVRAGKRERTGVRLRIGELEDHRPLGSREACDDASGALQTGHPEDPRAPDVRMPGGESVADVVEASLRVVHGLVLPASETPALRAAANTSHAFVLGRPDMT